MKQTNFELAVEVISQAVFELLPVEDSTHDETREAVNSLISCAEKGYVLVQWPESQEFMDKEWFEEEAIFCGGSEEKTGSSAYFIPIKRLVI